ncbi:T9SS type A sorting domain-containing protein [Chryseobacterium polytrichastri]|uniref:Por secretion system C-terminal sorting domain-containing protein n=1 Tax=Chryseobacterium polytrichastri TaxID=1302687 RepID=A0A1M7JG61_9FLAO|nr:T9SS type A sorting domain-containing protein [Chryseobacterium polytrichastri]SHM51901.1 Por secretion system C-terminal sorting domain-containing protein [Chryseobacterium polytrichastri]
MEKSLKKVLAILCLLSISVYSKNRVDSNNPNFSQSSKDVYLKSSDTIIKVLEGKKNKESNVINSSSINSNNQSNLRVKPTVVSLDWTKAPNSYIFDPSQNSEGLYVPVKKAYIMWGNDKYIGGAGIPDGAVTADVLWEDVHGLIKTGSGYSLEVLDSGLNAKIKVPVNKSKKGNAVIAFRVNGEIYWSWHIWVTDDPSNGPAYKSFGNVKRELSDGTIEPIPDSDWKWMDRNLGAVSNSMTSNEWSRSGGLLYQWGRKDPIPPLVTKVDDFYEASGSIGRVRHRGAKNLTNAIKIDDLTKYVLLSNAEVGNNLKLSIKNPLSLIYINKDDNSGPAYYNGNVNLPINWFGKSTTLADSQLTELNLWSDNSQGKITANYNSDDSGRAYRNKSSYDPCPNGWRVPSVLVANLGSATYADDVRVDFSPFGVRTNMGKDLFETNKYHIIKPTDNGVPGFMTGFKVYSNYWFDLSKVGGNNMGVFPGSGQIVQLAHEGQYSDQHHIGLWTATMPRHFDASPSVNARMLFMIPDKDQPDVPDPAFPNVKGRYFYMPLMTGKTSDANGCRCIKDPLYIANSYDFPTEYLPQTQEYREGINNPNTYQIVKNTAVTTIEIPVSKAFSVQSQLLNNQEILNSSNFNNLKVNVLWTTNSSLINKLTVVNPSPGSISAISASKILVDINPNQSGNAVVTLHNGSITNPVYWSWHIWVTDTPIQSNSYTTELPITGVTNYVNYVTKARSVLQTEFMDRNLGATDAFPIVANPLTPSTAELAVIKASTGLHYQWGRKDPLPVFQYADNRASYAVFLGKVNTNGTPSYTSLPYATYNNLSGAYIVPYNIYAANANVVTTDKVSDRVAKVLSYSVKNPLVYMIPSSFASYNSAMPLYTNGTDWLSTEPNLAADRWGRGGNKSPFDPCPEGWRIPDIMNSAYNSNQDFGITPWYKKDKNVGTGYSVSTDYLGIRVRNPSTTSTIGYTFNDPAYKIGNYPNSGSRGYRSVIANQTSAGTFNAVNFQFPGVWTAALNSNYIGRPIDVMFDAASTANRMTAFNDNNDPYFAMSCRCVKIKYDANGNEQGALPMLQITSLPATLASSALRKTEVLEKIKENKISLFPNPVKDVLYIKAPEEKGYFYQMYNMSGQLVKSGQFENGSTNVSSLISGIYLVRINNSESMVKIIKE